MTFVESTDNQQSPPPYVFPGVSINGCLLEATRADLQAWCDKFLNIGDRHKFTPLLPIVYVCVSHYPKMYSEEFEDFGYSSQDEYFCMFPLVRFVTIGNILIPVELSWAFPFIGVTNGTSAISGQMVLGYPKMVGEITRTTATDGSFEADVTMPGFVTFSPNSPQKPLRIIKLRTDAPATGPGSGLPFPWSMAETRGAVDGLEDFMLELLAELNPGLFTVTMLKQIRDGERPAQACFQTLMQAEWELSDIDATVELGGGSVDVYDNASVRISEILGLKGGVPIAPPPGGNPSTTTGMRFKALAAFSLDTDIRFGNVNDIGL